MMKTLVGKFVVFIIIPVICILSAMSILSYLMAHRLLIDQMKISEQNLLRASAEQVSSRVRQIQSILKVLALTEKLERQNDSDQRRLFVEIKDLIGAAVTSVFMGFPDGKFIRAKTTPLPEDYDPRKRPWYRDALRLPNGVLAGITEPYPDAITRHPTITLYHKVLNPSGELLGVLGVDVDVAIASGNLMRDLPRPAGGENILVDANAVVLLHPDERMVGSDIGSTGEALDRRVSEDIKDSIYPYKQYVGKRFGEAWYMGFYRVQGAPLCFVVRIPAKIILKPLHRLTFQMVVLGISMMICLLLILIVVTRRISQPIVDLMNSATRITEEGAYQDPLEVKSRDEVGQLTLAFNEMMEGLRQRDFIRDTFGRYVTKEVVEELLDTTDGLKLGGEIREVTIMFSDLRGFTPLCEYLHPDQVIEILNSYLSRMTEIIGRYKGTINEFVGDAILTFFGAPVQYGDSPERAVACASAMQIAMEEINRKNVEKDLPPLFMGIGINTGEVIVGNIGSKERAKYGVVGHNINLASRVEGVTVGGQILITPSTYEYIKDKVVIRSVHPVTFKGVEENIRLYDVAGIKEPYNLMLPDLMEESEPLETPIPVILHRMQGKKMDVMALSGELTHFSFPWAKVNISEEISPLQEMRVHLTGIEDADQIYMYVKVVRVTRKNDCYVHSVQITYLTPGLKKILGPPGMP